MPIKYACFISYRHGQRKLAERIINDLYDALESELETWLDEKVYLDRERLKGGDFYNEALAKALCESVCMIMIFTPTYFSADHTFCAREYKAMEKLEERRFQALGERVDKRRGLIIPIVFRGADYLPKEIKDRRLYYNFDKFLMSDVEISRHPEYAPKILEIAELIRKHYDALKAAASDPCQGCENFSLPSEDEIKQWLDQVQGTTVPFPGR
jgi:hypothetical protein